MSLHPDTKRRILVALRESPDITTAELSERFGIGRPTVQRLRKEAGVAHPHAKYADITRKKAQR